MTDEINELDFTLELTSRDLPKEIEDALFAEADKKLR
jgi:hypothetical protein